MRRVTRRGNRADGQAALEEDSWSLDKGDALLAETKSFVAAIRENRACEVSGADGVAALELAERIIAEIEQRGRPTRRA